MGEIIDHGPELGKILANAVDQLRISQEHLRMLEGKEPHASQYGTAVIGRAMHAATALYEAERDALRAEVAKLRAAQANMIDATGAVETGVFWYSGRYVVEIPKSMALSRVLIVPVKQ